MSVPPMLSAKGLKLPEWKPEFAESGVSQGAQIVIHASTGETTTQSLGVGTDDTPVKGYTNSKERDIFHESKVLVGLLMAMRSLVEGKRVLELGAGQGMCGYAAHRMGAKKVTLSDNYPKALEDLRKLAAAANRGAQSGGGVMDVQKVEWADLLESERAEAEQTPPEPPTGGQVPGPPPQEQEQLDLVFGSDILYHVKHAEYIAATFAAYIKPQSSCKGLIVLPCRGLNSHLMHLEAFSREAIQRGLGVAILPVHTNPSEGEYAATEAPTQETILALEATLQGAGMKWALGGEEEEEIYWKRIEESNMSNIAVVVARPPLDAPEA